MTGRVWLPWMVAALALLLLGVYQLALGIAGR